MLSANEPAPSLRAAFCLCSIGAVFEKTAAYGEAETCAVRVLAMLDGLPGASPSAVLLRLRGLGLLGTALRQQGKYQLAEAPLVRAIELAEAIPDRPEELSTAWNSLGVLCKYAGWFERGEQAYKRALEAAEQQTRHREAVTATILHNIGGLHHARGRFDLAEEPARRAWEMRRSMLGDEDAATLADAVAYAAVLDGLKRYSESRPIYEHALAVYERIFGPEHYETAAVLHNLALVEQAEGHHERALELARRSFEIKRRLLGAGHPDTALSAMNVASMRMKEDPVEARVLLGDALHAFERALAPDHPHIARCRQLIRVALPGLDAAHD